MSKFYKFLKDYFSSFAKHYSLKTKIGEGGYGDVYLVKQRADRTTLAAKIVKKQEITQWVVTKAGVKLPSEVWLLSTLSHTNIIEFYGYHKLSTRWVLLLNYNVHYSDLFTVVQEYGALSEASSKTIIHQLYNVINYCFTQDVDHRDIKAENILVNTTTLHIKLIDFGSATFCKMDTPYTEGRGTSLFLPPEHHSQSFYYPNEAAVWSLGCLTYFMLLGDVPFHTDEEIVYCEFEGFNYAFLAMSKKCQLFITQCLEKSREERLKWSEVKHHLWLWRLSAV